MHTFFSLLLKILFCVYISAYEFSAPHDGYTVNQIHIAQGATPESMSFSWATSSKISSELKYGLSPEGMMNMVVGSSTRYSFNYPGLSNYTSPYLHTAYVNHGLQPSTLYYYQVGDFTEGITSGNRNIFKYLLFF